MTCSDEISKILEIFRSQRTSKNSPDVSPSSSVEHNLAQLDISGSILQQPECQKLLHNLTYEKYSDKLTLALAEFLDVDGDFDEIFDVIFPLIATCLPDFLPKTDRFAVSLCDGIWFVIEAFIENPKIPEKILMAVDSIIGKFDNESQIKILVKLANYFYWKITEFDEKDFDPEIRSEEKNLKSQKYFYQGLQKIVFKFSYLHLCPETLMRLRGNLDQYDVYDLWNNMYNMLFYTQLLGNLEILGGPKSWYTTTEDPRPLPDREWMSRHNIDFNQFEIIYRESSFRNVSVGGMYGPESIKWQLFNFFKILDNLVDKDSIDRFYENGTMGTPKKLDLQAGV